MFHTTKANKTYYFAFESLKNNRTITDHSQNYDCCLDYGVRRYPGYALLFLAVRSPGCICAINARPEILALAAQGYFNY